MLVVQTLYIAKRQCIVFGNLIFNNPLFKYLEFKYITLGQISLKLMPLDGLYHLRISNCILEPGFHSAKAN